MNSPMFHPLHKSEVHNLSRFCYSLLQPSTGENPCSRVVPKAPPPHTFWPAQWTKDRGPSISLPLKCSGPCDLLTFVRRRTSHLSGVFPCSLMLPCVGTQHRSPTCGRVALTVQFPPGINTPIPTLEATTSSHTILSNRGSLPQPHSN